MLDERSHVQNRLARRLCVLASASSLLAQTTVVRPTEIDDVLVNPGMGIETFQRFKDSR